MEKYRVTTDELQRFNKGDEVYAFHSVRPGFWVASSINNYISREVIERNPEWFEKVEGEFKEGQWLYHDTGVKKWIFKYGYKLNDEYHGTCAINLNNGYYYETYRKPIGGEIRPATTEEIEQALTREARRRCFGEGVKIEQNYSKLSTKKTLSSDDFWYDSPPDKLVCGGVWVYLGGEWAEIIEEDEPIEINGYEVTKTGSDIHPYKVGCTTPQKYVWLNLRKYITSFDISIHRKGEDITEQIREIAKRLK